VIVKAEEPKKYFMSANHLNESIRNFLLEKFPLARKRGVRFDDNLLESGIIDSLGILDLVTFLEQSRGIILSDEELVPDNFLTIDRLSAFVQSKVPAEEKQSK
jgi:acyl carrier protein